MRKILSGLLIFAAAALIIAPARAQEDATQQQIDKLSGQIQDIYGILDKQDKRITALEKQVSDLGDKLNQPAANNYASADDLKKLADQVQEIDKKRQDDNEKILDALEKISKSGGLSSGHKTPDVSTAPSPSNSTSGIPQKGYEYPIQSGDTVIAIAKAYQAKGVKVTVKQILDANPGLDPKNMMVGKTIFIPQP